MSVAAITKSTAMGTTNGITIVAITTNHEWNHECDHKCDHGWNRDRNPDCHHELADSG